jgi:hypothetical protein
VRKGELPEAVRKAWGSEAAKDFLAWLDEYLREVRPIPEVQISAFVARQKVNVLMLERVSNLLLADEPRLVQRPDGHWVWQVPVDLTFPSRGRVGCVGELEVDARYGEVRYSDASLAQIDDNARRLSGQVLHPVE